MIFKSVSAEALKPGERVRYLGSVYTVNRVRPSLGHGFEVVFTDGPAANFVGSVAIVDDARIAAFLAGQAR